MIHIYIYQGAEGYSAFVASLKKEIYAGNVIQAVPSQRLARPMHPELHPFDIYRELRAINPSPYMYYFNFGEFQVVGASPEQLLQVNLDRKVTTHPIAGRSNINIYIRSVFSVYT